MNNFAFPAAIDHALKSTVSRYPRVHISAIQDDIDMCGPPEAVFGDTANGGTDEGALMHMLEELRKVGLEPNRQKFQLYATTEAAAEYARDGGFDWLPRPFHVTDDTTRASIEKLEEEAKMTAARAVRKGATRQQKRAAAAAKKKAADARRQLPEKDRAYGIITCGAAVGLNEWKASYLRTKAREVGRVVQRVTTALMAEDAQCASISLYLSIQCRINYLLATLLPWRRERWPRLPTLPCVSATRR